MSNNYTEINNLPYLTPVEEVVNTDTNQDKLLFAKHLNIKNNDINLLKQTIVKLMEVYNKTIQDQQELIELMADRIQLQYYLIIVLFIIIGVMFYFNRNLWNNFL